MPLSYQRAVFGARAALCLAFALLVMGCNKQSVREELDSGGKVVAREYTGGSADYALYVQGVSQQRPAAIDPTACQGDARCVENLAAFAAMAQMAGNGRSAIAPPAPAKTFGDRLESVAKAALGILPALGGQYVGLESSRNSRDVAMAQYGFLGGVVTDVTSASATIAQSGPRIDVGGDYVGGDRTETNIGDDYTGGNRSETNTSVGGDQVGGDQRIGDDVGRDQIGRDRTDNSGIIGDYNEQRIGSDGPIDDHSDNGDCDGAGGCDNGGG